MRLLYKILGFSLFALFPVQGSGVITIDSYDAAVVRAILDSVGWKSVPVDSVATASSLSISSKASSSRVVELNLASRTGLPKIERLPAAVGSLPELVSLSLRGNAIAELPPQIGALRKLKRLDLSVNALKRIPGGIDSLPIQRLDASFNRIDSLSLAPGGFFSVQMLFMDHNPLRSIPDSIGSLTQLHSLSFASNALTTIPSAVTKLSNLTALNLDSNQLAALPSGLTGLSQLKIGVSGNRLCSLATEVGKWLDEHAMAPDWNASQQCKPLVFGSVVSELTTGTVIHVTDAKALSAACAPMLIDPVEPGNIHFQERRILKAVDVRFNDCLGAAQRSFLITFSWADYRESASHPSDLSIYYIGQSGIEYLGGAVNDTNATISVTSSRAGRYVLTASTILPAGAKRPAGEENRAAAVRFAAGIGSVEAFFVLTAPSSVRMRLISLSGKLLFESTATLSAGTHRMNVPVRIRRSAAVVVNVQCPEFNAHRILHIDNY
jgi:hypothetical protein